MTIFNSFLYVYQAGYIIPSGGIRRPKARRDRPARRATWSHHGSCQRGPLSLAMSWGNTMRLPSFFGKKLGRLNSVNQKKNVWKWFCQCSIECGSIQSTQQKWGFHGHFIGIVSRFSHWMPPITFDPQWIPDCSHPASTKSLNVMNGTIHYIPRHHHLRI